MSFAPETIEQLRTCGLEEVDPEKIGRAHV